MGLLFSNKTWRPHPSILAPLYRLCVGELTTNKEITHETGCRLTIRRESLLWYYVSLIYKVLEGDEIFLKPLVWMSLCSVTCQRQMPALLAMACLHSANLYTCHSLRAWHWYVYQSVYCIIIFGSVYLCALFDLFLNPWEQDKTHRLLLEWVLMQKLTSGRSTFHLMLLANVFPNYLLVH